MRSSPIKFLTTFALPLVWAVPAAAAAPPAARSGIATAATALIADLNAQAKAAPSDDDDATLDVDGLDKLAAGQSVTDDLRKKAVEAVREDMSDVEPGAPSIGPLFQQAVDFLWLIDTDDARALASDIAYSTLALSGGDREATFQTMDGFRRHVCDGAAATTLDCAKATVSLAQSAAFLGDTVRSQALLADWAANPSPFLPASYGGTVQGVAPGQWSELPFDSLRAVDDLDDAYQAAAVQMRFLALDYILLKRSPAAYAQDILASVDHPPSSSDQAQAFGDVFASLAANYITATAENDLDGRQRMVDLARQVLVRVRALHDADLLDVAPNVIETYIDQFDASIRLDRKDFSGARQLLSARLASLRRNHDEIPSSRRAALERLLIEADLALGSVPKDGALARRTLMVEAVFATNAFPPEMDSFAQLASTPLDYVVLWNRLAAALTREGARAQAHRLTTDALTFVKQSHVPELIAEELMTAGRTAAASADREAIDALLSAALVEPLAKPGTTLDAEDASRFALIQVLNSLSTASAISTGQARANLQAPGARTEARQFEQALDQWSNSHGTGKSLLSTTAVVSGVPGVWRSFEAFASQPEAERYFTLRGSAAADPGNVQMSLTPDERLVIFTILNGRLLATVVSRPTVAPRPNDTYILLPTPLSAISGEIASLRRGLVVSDTASATPVYDLALARRLYQQLIVPLQNSIGSAKTLYVVPDGPLQDLPLGVLVTSAETTPDIADFARYRKASWLADRYSLAVVPAVSSFVLLRSAASVQTWDRDLLSIEAPQHDGAEALGPVYPLDLASIEASGPRATDVITTLSGPNATLNGLTALNTSTKLRSFRWIAFDTHGLTWAESHAYGLDEPALVLAGGPVDGANGFLTTSDITRLDLSSELVLLLACNTAAPGGGREDSLSGLARSFFYAGSSGVLASNWAVDATATPALAKALWAQPTSTPLPQRLQVAMRAIRMTSDLNTPQWSHPAYWGSFMLVGGVGLSPNVISP